MESLKVDKTKLVTVRNFAVKKAVTTQQVYNWIKAKKVKTESIDGVTFVSLD
jgi:hypothetical protein